MYHLDSIMQRWAFQTSITSGYRYLRLRGQISSANVLYIAQKIDTPYVLGRSGVSNRLYMFNHG